MASEVNTEAAELPARTRVRTAPAKAAARSSQTDVAADPARAGEAASALFLAQRWSEAAQAYAEVLDRWPGHEQAGHWTRQLETSRANLDATPQIEVVDPRFARPDAANTAFPKPTPDALQVARPAAPAPSLRERLRDRAGRLAGAVVDAGLGAMTAAIPDRALFGSAGRPRHTNWYVQKKALAALRLRGLSVADMLSVLKLAKTRDNADRRNLYDAYATGGRAALLPEGARPPATAGVYRQTDGAWTDLDRPTAGAAFTLFGRNTDPAHTRTDDDASLMDPSPAEVARVLLHCDRPEGQREIPFLNTIAGWWIQFQNHDWVVAGDPHPTETHMVPLGPDDPRRRQFGVDALPVPKRVASPHAALARPGVTARTNVVTSWWDGSQIYGSGDTDLRLPSGELVACGLLRAPNAAGEPGKGAHLDLPEGFLPVDPATGVERSGLVNRTWHLGLSFLHALFAHEHNAIVDMLRARYPGIADEDAFQTARLINAAVMAKIHTVEWTPAVLPNRILNDGMNGNWYGLIANLFRQGRHREALRDLGGVQIQNREFGGIIGNDRRDHGVDYSLTQEFMSVYRLHSLIMDRIVLRAADGSGARDVPLAATRMRGATRLAREFGLEGVALSAGTSHPGQLVLNNFAPTLTQLAVPGFPVMDIAMTDVLRDREDGVPRFNEFRRRWGMPAFTEWADFTDDAGQIARLRAVYQRPGDTEQAGIDRVDLLVGTLASVKRPAGYGFGEELFTLFILNASRRLEADPFYTTWYDAAHYTQAGLDWIDDVDLKAVLLRHFPGLARSGLANVANAFEPWDVDPALLADPGRHPLMHGGVDPIVR
jgi:hypothetical protein